MQGEAVLGPFIFFDDPAVVELAGLAGFDFVVIDMEHTAHGLADVRRMVMACEIEGVTPLVRVPEVDEKLIGRVLETGALGIMVPMIETAEDAARAASAMHYPPAGARGTYSHNRPSRYGFAIESLPQYFAEADRELLLIGLIETPRGVANVGEILDAGVDVAILGRGDLSSFMDLPGEPAHPSVMKAADHVFAAASERGETRWCGMAGAFGPDEIEAWGSRGCRFFLWGDDLSVLTGAWRTAIDQRRSSLDALGR
jgi:2-keto-3-deoxy-L-rhamnonate aldolase RhmA